MARQTTPRTRNLGTLTESQYMGKIRSALRQAFKWWKPAAEAKRQAKRKDGLYVCARCGQAFPSKMVAVDHVIPCGSLLSLDDLAGFVARLTPEDPSAFQVLCAVCHDDKSKADLAAMRAERAARKG